METFSPRKREILEQCFEHFSEYGYHGLSMRTLAQNLGITTGSLYHHYKSKAELFCDLVTFHSQGDMEAITGLFSREDLDDDDPVDLLLGFVEARKDYFRRMILIVLDLNRGSDSSDKDLSRVRLQVQDALLVYQKAFATLLEIPDPLARALLSFVIGTLSQQVIRPDSAQLNDLKVFLEGFMEVLS